MQPISLSQIEDNPYQTRREYDPAGIEELGRDIAARGLLQIPVARPTPSSSTLTSSSTLDSTYQLAFGHRRLRAYRWLHEHGNLGYALMPLEIRTLTDEEMALFAWSENAQRRDLTPVEMAEAIRKMIDAFGWTQTEAAERLGLDRSTVANKLRLLSLPEDLQARLRDGRLSERQAVAVAPVMALPAPVLDAIKNTDGSRYWYKDIQRDIEAGVPSDQLRRTTQSTLEHALANLAQAPWPLDQPLADELGPSHQVPAVHSPRCDGCDLRVDTRCAGPACYKLKAALWADRQIVPLAAGLGLPYIPRAQVESSEFDRGRYRVFCNWEQTELAYALDHRCPNLHVASNPNHGSTHVKVQDHEQLEYVCWSNGNTGRCKCRDAAIAARDADQVAAQKALNRRLTDLRQQAVQTLAKALLAGDTAALRALTNNLWRRSNNWDRADDAYTMEPANLASKAASLIVGDILAQMGGAEQLQRQDAWFRKCGFDPATLPWSDLIAASKPSTDPEPPHDP